MKKLTESSIVTACLELLSLRRIMAWRSNQGVIPGPNGAPRRFRGRKGVADILGCLDDGRLLAVEVKKPGGRLSPEQREFLDAVRQRGGLAVVVHSVGELDALLRLERLV